MYHTTIIEMTFSIWFFGRKLLYSEKTDTKMHGK